MRPGGEASTSPPGCGVNLHVHSPGTRETKAGERGQLLPLLRPDLRLAAAQPVPPEAIIWIDCWNCSGEGYEPSGEPCGVCEALGEVEMSLTAAQPPTADPRQGTP